jgi:GMP synthase-like glutamine amidotransferase
MRVGAHAYGMQFHCEIVDETVSDWRRVPEYWASLITALGRDGAEGLDNVVTPRLPAFRETARRLNGNFARIVAGN